MLVEHGFRLPSALDNRPLRFEEFVAAVPQVLYVSATPAPYELEKCGGLVTEQIIRIQKLAAQDLFAHRPGEEAGHQQQQDRRDAQPPRQPLCGNAENNQPGQHNKKVFGHGGTPILRGQSPTCLHAFFPSSLRADVPSSRILRTATRLDPLSCQEGGGLGNPIPDDIAGFRRRSPPDPVRCDTPVAARATRRELSP